MFSTNKLRHSHNHVLIIVLILISFSIGSHFLHDLQPGHSDILGISSIICNGTLHFGIYMDVFPAVLIVALLVKIEPSSRRFPRINKLSVLVPPPIRW